MKKAKIEFLYQLYDTKGYILVMLKEYSDFKGELNKKIIKLENFNIGKSQFYKIFQELKLKKYIKEKDEKIYLNLCKIEEYISKLENEN